MNESAVHSCLFLPCSAAEIWAVPKNSLAEIVTLYEVGEVPPRQISWRGHQVPVLDMDETRETRWRDSRAGTGLVAVLLGIDGLGCRYLGVALRGQGLGLHQVPEDEVEDRPAEALPRSMGAFRWRNVTYQVPDLLGMQEEIARERERALEEAYDLSLQALGQ
jgi:hypothetical protein